MNDVKNELIEIKTNDNLEVVISGRELHEKLGIKTKFQDWFKRMISYGFIENIDFVKKNELSQKREGSRIVERVLEDYFVKLDVAKEICMLQRNEKGKMFRNYFIQVEKDYNSPEKIMARALIFSKKKIEELEVINNKMLEDNKMLEVKVEKLEPKAKYYDEILNFTRLKRR